jgi:putative nucleotidyltransferase with HDIG domain
MGLPSVSNGWTNQLGTGIFALALIGLTLWYLKSFYPEVVASSGLMLLLDVSIVFAAAAGRLAIPGHPLFAYFLPVAGVAALTGILISSEVGVAVAVLVALLLTWLSGASFELVSYYLLTGVGGAMAVRQLRRLNDFLTIGATITAVGLLLIAAFRLAGPDNWTLTFMRDYGAAAVINGLFASSLAFGGFVVLGSTFGVATSLHLLELGHPDQPLLRRLMADAPGTYNHSLVVASMVERAAQETGSNVLLARVMALYHDIGKIANPLCFIENQIGTSNIHDDLKPQESAEIIRAHVTHGAALARQYRLPTPIRDAILQHHGTMKMLFFFHRALEEDPTADAELYSYPGPRPHTKEIALLMMADGCEGAVRALPEKTPETIRDTVNRIVDDRVATGQLSRCDLSLRDLSNARVAFVDVLSGIYHPRVEYPAPSQPATP